MKIKLKSVEVERDYSLNRILHVEFSDYKISVIYGENGCGKTTILRLINAFLSQNDSIFSQEKVLWMSISFQCEYDKSTVYVKRVMRKERTKDENGDDAVQITTGYDWSEFLASPLAEISSILFGVNRGISNSTDITEEEIYNSIQAIGFRERFNSSNELMMFSHLLGQNLNMNRRRRRRRKVRDTLDLTQRVLNIESVSMEVVEELLSERYRMDRIKSNAKVQKALFDTLAEACDSLDEKDIDITEEEYHRILLKNKERLILALSSGTTNTLSQRIVGILRAVDEKCWTPENGESPLLKKLIYNMSKELNDESEYIQAINRLEDIFNEYIGPQKYLEISEEKVVVRFRASGEIHSISALSSGERHLLVLLTIFVIEGENRQLFMVDEPEISLNIVWQRKLLPLLSELAPNAEIIVASHSPSIARANSNYLVGMR